MSAIQKKLADLIEVSPKRGEDRQAYLNRCVAAIEEISEDEWNALPEDVQDWFNTAADAKNAKKATLPDFPDAETEKQEEAPSRRRRGGDDSAAKEEQAGTKVEVKEEDVKEGMVLTVVTSRGKEFTGHVDAVLKEGIDLKLGNGEIEELDFDRIKSMHTLSAAAEEKPSRRRRGDDAGKDDEPADPLAVGAEVTVKTKRGKEITGTIVEIDEEVLVLKTADGEEELGRDRIDSITPTKKAEGSTGRRRGAAKDDKAGDGKGDKPPRSTNPVGVSVGAVIRDLMTEDLGITEEEVEKELKKQKLEFRPATLSMIYKDTAYVIASLKKNGHLKGK